MSNSHDHKDAKIAMDSMYRLTRHVYDATRKYYLLGRDYLIRHLHPAPDSRVCEVGCGTARNLVKMAQTYPQARFFGLDASDEMLKTARRALERSGYLGEIPIAQGYAQSFDPRDLFGLSQPVDQFVFSYALSIIPPWRESLDHVVNLLPRGGSIHIVDFGGQEDFPAWFRRFVFWWLAKFHVYHKPEILEYLREMSAAQRGTLKIQHLYGGYAYYAVFTKV
jgi:S-adenosylmethionine-diacylgycerolhomoserine-N-methlytransferase